MSVAEASPLKRMEANLVAYLRTVFPGAGMEVLGTNDPIIEPDAQTQRVIECMAEESDASYAPLGIAMSATITLRLTSHPSVVTADEHTEAFQRLRSSVIDDPPRYIPGQPVVIATRAVLNAVNRVPGALDSRPQSGVHLFDLLIAGESVGPSDNDMQASVLELTALYGGWDWEGPAPYP
jgi:hypothetical protein